MEYFFSEAPTLEGPWTPLCGGFGNKPNGMCVHADGRVYIVGVKGMILRSLDRGTLWTLLASHTHQTLHAIALGTDGQLLVGGSEGVLLHSSDGVVFRSVPSPTKHTIVEIVADAERFFVRTEQHELFVVSADGTRSEACGTLSFVVHCMLAAKDGTLYAAGEKGSLVGSSDQGKSWKKAKLPSKAQLNAIAQNEEGFFCLVGARGLVLTSSDGRTWNRVDTGSSAELTAVWTRGERVVITEAGNIGGILLSEDHGQSFQRRPSSVRATTIAGWNDEQAAVMLLGTDVYRWNFRDGFYPCRTSAMLNPASLLQDKNGTLWMAASCVARSENAEQWELVSALPGEECYPYLIYEFADGILGFQDRREVLFLAPDGTWSSARSESSFCLEDACGGPEGKLCITERTMRSGENGAVHIYNGTQWHRTPIQGGDWPHCWWAPDGTLWVSAQEGPLLRSLDGGLSFTEVDWNRAQLPKVHEHWAGRVFAITGTSAYVLLALSKGWIARSRDGKHFTHHSLPSSDFVVDALVHRDGSVVLCMNDGCLCVSRDDGETFTRVEIGKGIVSSVLQTNDGRWMAALSVK